MNEQALEIGGPFLANYLGWVLFPIILLIGHFLIRLISRYVAHFFDRVDYDRTIEVLVQRTLGGFLWMVVIILALANVGFDVSGFIAGLGVMGIIVGLAVKDVLSNLAAGLFLLVKRPFHVGEEIDVAGVVGKVKEMTLSSCVVITEDQQYVTIPNSKIWGNPIRNLSRLQGKS